MIKSIGFYDEDSATAPVHGLQLKDKRYDPVVAAGLVAVDRAMHGHALDDAERTAIIGITDGGCSVHVARVVDGIAADKPRQAFFVRAGAQTIATYAAMALGTHGPAMTLSGPASMAATSWVIALQLMSSGLASEVILIGADRPGDRLVAAALVLSPAAHTREQDMLHLLAADGARGSGSPVLALHAAASAVLRQ